METTSTSQLVRRAMLALGFVLLSSTLAAAAVKFYGAGQIPGGDYGSDARDARHTTNGLLMVGTVSISSGEVAGDTAASWSPQTGWQLLADPFPANISLSFVAARVIAANGHVIGGSTNSAPSGHSRSPALWTNHGTAVNLLGLLPGTRANFFPNVGVNGLSEDGTVAYGFDADAQGIAAFRHTAAGGMVNLGYLHPDDGTNFTALHGVSSDGRVMVGTSSGGVSQLGAYRYVYTGQGPTGGTMTALPALPGGAATSALAITPDARCVIGTSSSPDYPGGQLVRWDEDGQITPLGSPSPTDPTFTFGYMSVNKDASVVVASGATADSLTDTAYMRNRHGWFSLQAILTQAGANLADWQLTDVTTLRENGTLLCGIGIHNNQPEAWVAEVSPGLLRRAGRRGNDSESEDGSGD
jgi:uncharacterized membrane protein